MNLSFQHWENKEKQQTKIRTSLWTAKVAGDDGMSFNPKLFSIQTIRVGFLVFLEIRKFGQRENERKNQLGYKLEEEN